MIIAGCFLQSRATRANEVGSDMMFDLWKYRTGEGDTGLLTGKPSKPEAAKPPPITAHVTGTIYYKQRITLLPNDVVEVQLLDISRQDTPAAIIARQNITQTDRVSIPFKLSYDPTNINPAHKFAVLARILSNGQVRFKNSADCYVITYGHPNHVDILVEMTSPDSPDKQGVQTDSAVRGYIGTYKRTFMGAGGTVEETLHIRSNETAELHSSYTKGAVQQVGVWSPEGKQLAVTLTQKNGAYINPERIVFELKGGTLEAVEFDRNAYGPQYIFMRTIVPGNKK